MVKWIKASKGSRQISVVSSVEGMALKVGAGERMAVVALTHGMEVSSGMTVLRVGKASKIRRKAQTSTNSEL